MFPNLRPSGDILSSAHTPYKRLRLQSGQEVLIPSPGFEPPKAYSKDPICGDQQKNKTEIC
jgi:hypothetical protein